MFVCVFECKTECMAECKTENVSEYICLHEWSECKCEWVCMIDCQKNMTFQIPNYENNESSHS